MFRPQQPSWKSGGPVRFGGALVLVGVVALTGLFAACRPKVPQSLPTQPLDPGLPVDPCLLDCSERLPPWPEAWKMAVFDTEDCVRFASKATGFEGATLSLCTFESAMETVPKRGQRHQTIDLGDRVVKCLTGQIRKGVEVTCDVHFRSRKWTPALRLEYRGKDWAVLHPLLRFAGEASLILFHCGEEHMAPCGLCMTSDIRFLQSQERIVHDDLLLSGEAPLRKPVWPPDLPPDQDKPAPTCSKQERPEPAVDPAARCYMRFGFARNASLQLGEVRPASRPDCEDATIVAMAREHVRRTIGTISSCNGGMPPMEVDKRSKSDTWHGRGWVGDVVVVASGADRWSATVQLSLADYHPFSAAVSIQSVPLDREDMRNFLLAVSNGGFYPADCTTSAMPDACTACRQIRTNRERWHDIGRDLHRMFIAP